MRTISEETVNRNGDDCAAELARFFRTVKPVRIPADATVTRPGNASLRETVTVEYCGRQHAIFRSTLPIEYNDDVHLRARKSGEHLGARVVAVQYHQGLKAVAVRFESATCDWVTTT